MMVIYVVPKFDIVRSPIFEKLGLYRPPSLPEIWAGKMCFYPAGGPTPILHVHQRLGAWVLS